MGKRIRFIEGGKVFFDAINAKGKSILDLAKEVELSTRTIRDWRRGAVSLPFTIAAKWANEFGLSLPPYVEYEEEEMRSKAGLIGGKARQLQYGNIGTPEGRRRGGLNAQKTHMKNPASPFISRAVPKPDYSEDLAELVGAILGDGTITKYQLILFSNLKDEKEYALYLGSLVERLFGTPPAIHITEAFSIIRVISSRRQIIDYLLSIGLSLGNKVKNQVGVPRWIEENPKYMSKCLRGLVDTDGCVYIDNHTVKGKKYSSLCIAFTNASTPLLDFVEKAMFSMGYHPTRFGRHIRLRIRAEVLNYAEKVGFSNPKHSGKIKV